MMINQAKTQAKTENVENEAIASVENQYWVNLKEALDRLNSNEDFKLVIKEGYFKDKAVNGVSMLGLLCYYPINGYYRQRIGRGVTYGSV